MLKRAEEMGLKKADDERDFTIEDLPLVDLEVDRNYQRPVSEKWVQELARKWNDKGATPIKVSQRSVGHNVILDGQHRTLALISIGRETAPCQVFKGLTREQEAEIWIRGNTMRLPHILNRFHSRVEAKDAVAVDITQIVEAMGTKISWDKTHGISCVAALEEIYTWGVLPRTLALIQSVWRDLDDRFERVTIMGTAAFFKMHGKELDEKILVEKLKAAPLTSMLNRARSLGDLSPERRDWANLAGLLREAYNRNARTNRLPEKIVPVKAKSTWSQEGKRGK